MNDPARVFQILPDPDDEPAPAVSHAPSAQGAVQGAAVAGLMLALRALSQRALVALADLFFLLTAASAFYLWITIPDPNPHQLISLGMYAVFILVANIIVRRKK